MPGFFVIVSWSYIIESNSDNRVCGVAVVTFVIGCLTQVPWFDSMMGQYFFLLFT